MRDYKECPECGVSLDHGERCECECGQVVPDKKQEGHGMGSLGDYYGDPPAWEDEITQVVAYDTGETVDLEDAAEYMGEFFVTGAEGMNAYAAEIATKKELEEYAVGHMEEFKEFVKENALLMLDGPTVRLETGKTQYELIRSFANGDSFYDWLDERRAGAGFADMGMGEVME